MFRLLGRRRFVPRVAGDHRRFCTTTLEEKNQMSQKNQQQQQQQHQGQRQLPSTAEPEPARQQPSPHEPDRLHPFANHARASTDYYSLVLVLLVPSLRDIAQLPHSAVLAADGTRWDLARFPSLTDSQWRTRPAAGGANREWWQNLEPSIAVLCPFHMLPPIFCPPIPGSRGPLSARMPRPVAGAASLGVRCMARCHSFFLSSSQSGTVHDEFYRGRTPFHSHAGAATERTVETSSSAPVTEHIPGIMAFASR
ncbi:hypothetical protein CCMA1212_000765 [Trichoderma ghanense]|uniref:Uncharacterized protein n=1 Tax=Trichoderma ghanense TaxID=65468 RepID=A0ABY2HH56_9HYPO